MTHEEILNSILYNTGKEAIGIDPIYSIMKLTSRTGSDAWILAKVIVSSNESGPAYEILSYKINNSDNALDKMLAEAEKLGIKF